MNAIAFSDLPDTQSGASICAHGSNVGLCEFCVWVFRAFQLGRKEAAALVAHVLHVIGLSPKEKVIWADTGRVVAMVANAQPGRYWSMSEHPRHPVGADRFSVLIEELSRAFREKA